MKNKTYIWHSSSSSGEIRSPNIRLAKSLLLEQGIEFNKIHSKTIFNTLLKKRIKQAEIISLLEQLADMLKAGLDLLASIDFIIHSLKNKSLRKIIAELKQQISQGKGFSEALADYPNLFDPLTRQLIFIGEQSGNLDGMVSQAAAYKKQQAKLKSQLISAMIYPSAVLCIASLVTLMLLIFVIPQFQEFFSSYQQQLPFLTAKIIALSEMLRHYYLYLFLLIAMLMTALYSLKKYSKKFSYLLDKWILKPPFIGKCLEDSMLSRSASALAMMFSAGITLPDSLKMTAELCQNQIHQQAWLQIKAKLEQGNSLANSMEDSQIFPPMCTQMIASGENTGKLDSMLQHIASFYTEALNRKIYRFKELLEPCMMLILGVIIAVLIIAMYLPIFKLGTIIG